MSAYGGERLTGEPCAIISQFWAKEVSAAISASLQRRRDRPGRRHPAKLPHIEQDAFTRCKQHDQFRTMAEGFSAAGGNIEPGDRNSPAIAALWHNVWNYRTDLNMTNQPFESFEAKFGPWMRAGDSYTALIRNDLNNSYTSTLDYGIDITGYGSRQNFSQVFRV
ncbi:hypothetical protein LY78DRAFT_709377 [Colletotrichum sublineola]|nr:hypothetical protein LY78DRAFT_709377 [Colletotrichum sublineola]